MAYQDIGFDEFLQRSDSLNSGPTDQLDSLQADTYLQELSGSKIAGGLISSPDGRLKIDLENNVFKVNNGVTDLVSFGVLEDGSVGLLIKNGDGKALMQVSETTQFIQSPNQHFLIDFIKEYLLSKDEKGLPRALFGKGDF